MNYKLWVVIALLAAGLIGTSVFINRSTDAARPTRVDVSQEQLDKIMNVDGEQEPAKKATKTPGRVVSLETNRGTIEFVLYEVDCPKTTSRIAELVEGGFYDGVSFPRVEDWVIQTDSATKEVTPMGIEVVEGLIHAKGTVGMARTQDPNSNTSVFYITLEPAFHLDMEYTNFGRVIKGMGVAMNIQQGDKIKSAKLRPLTDDDKKLFNEALKIESDRRTQ